MTVSARGAALTLSILPALVLAGCSSGPPESPPQAPPTTAPALGGSPPATPLVMPGLPSRTAHSVPWTRAAAHGRELVVHYPDYCRGARPVIRELPNAVVVWMREQLPDTRKPIHCFLIRGHHDNVVRVRLVAPVGSRPIVHGAAERVS